MDLKEEVTDKLFPDIGLKLKFAAVDLAPNEQLETGFSVVDRERVLIRMDKLYRNDEIIKTVESLGPLNGTVVVIDMPKNLSIPGRWRQEEIKMHALRLRKRSGEVTERFEERGRKLYNGLDAKGVMVFLYFNYWTRVNYEMLIPFRSRSPQGCRALQNAIDHQLGIKNLPINLAPSSVLESMVGAYASWSLWAGKPGEDYQVYLDEHGYRILIPKGRPHVGKPPPIRYRRRRRNLKWYKPPSPFKPAE
jgi:hypothetical protein